MGRDLVLISHGDFCQALKASTEMIMGPQEHIHTVSFYEEEDVEQFSEKLGKVLATLSDVVVMADLFGGTPANVASRLILEGAQFDLYTGVNMAMVIGFLNAELLGEPLEALSSGMENMKYVNQLLAETSEDLDDED